MPTDFLDQRVWSTITRAARTARGRPAVAVAYFGAGASRLLPLQRGARLVVDASERAIRSGQTCPSDLSKLVARGVDVFTVSNLHAKVFVFERRAIIGSTNVSTHSAEHLVEAAVSTTDRAAIRAARSFVEGLCLQQLTPERLKQLAKLYRPPRFSAGGRRHRRRQRRPASPDLPRLILVQLVPERWSERDDQVHDRGLTLAKKRQRHHRGYELEDFRWTGKNPFGVGDQVMLVTKETAGRVLASAPGNITHIERDRARQREAETSFVYVERPTRRRRNVRSLAGMVGYPRRVLLRNGAVRSRDLTERLLMRWALI